MCESAQSARKTESQFKGFFEGLVIRRGFKRAVTALSHRLLKVVYVVLKKKEAYRDPKIDYEALMVKRNKARWLRALKKFGFLPDSSVAEKPREAMGS